MGDEPEQTRGGNKERMRRAGKTGWRPNDEMQFVHAARGKLNNLRENAAHETALLENTTAVLTQKRTISGSRICHISARSWSPTGR